MNHNPKIKRPIIVIVGPTGSGKTALSIRVAKQFGCEIISADSRAVYKGMDIGSAKPTIVERDGVPHWGLDLVEPHEHFTVANFKRYAEQKICEIEDRGHIPIVVGGTGLYIDSLIFDYQFPAKIEAEQRAKWENLTIEELHKYCLEHNIVIPENKHNKRYVINTIVRNGHALKRRATPAPSMIVVGISTEKEVLRERISHRTRQFFASGVMDEALDLANKYGWDCEAMTGNIYPLIHRYVLGEIDQNEMESLFNIKEWHLAKRQLTWFKRNEHITWLSLQDAYTYLAHALD